MGPIQELARDLGAEERTLRRAASQGTLHARRISPRRLRLALGEHEYLRTHWQLLSDLRQSLRTRRDVRLAVLYGSLARGDEDAGSDLDLLISLTDGHLSNGASLAAGLRQVTERPLDIAYLRRVEERAPLLLDRVLDEGRVLVDRDGQWLTLQGRRRAIHARARRAHRSQMVVAARAIEELTQ